MKIEKTEYSYIVTECDLKFGEQITLDGEVLIPTSVLDKVKAEFIARYPKNYMGELELGGRFCVFSLNQILCIIDKYREENEE